MVNPQEMTGVEGPLQNRTTAGFQDATVLARTIVQIAEDKKAENILMLDIHSQSVIADYFVIRHRHQRPPGPGYRTGH